MFLEVKAAKNNGIWNDAVTSVVVSQESACTVYLVCICCLFLSFGFSVLLVMAQFISFPVFTFAVVERTGTTDADRTNN